MTYETDSILMELLREQHGLVRVRQALRLGVPEHRIKQMVRAGRLRRIGYGIIAAPGVPESDDFRSMLGVLLGGHGLTEGIVSALAGPSSAWKQGLITSRPERIHIVSTRRVKCVDGFVFHRTGRLPEVEIRIIDAIPTTDPVRTFLDLCHIQRWKAKGAFYRGLREGRFTKEAVLRRIETESRQGRQGLQRAREIVLGTTPGAEKAKSAMEETVMRWIIDGNYPLPERNVLIPSSYGHDWEIDFLYSTPLLVIEVSPWDTHNDPETYWKDVRKREDLEAMGYVFIVVTEKTARASFYRSMDRHF